jgi:hypothetical protein
MPPIQPNTDPMPNTESIESYLLRSEIAHEQLDSTTWLIRLDDSRKSQVVLRVEDPIALASIAILTLDDQTPAKEDLFRTILELNSDLLHCAYSLQDDRIVLSGAHRLEDLDYSEFQSLIDDLTMARDNHKDALTRWTRSN